MAFNYDLKDIKAPKAFALILFAFTLFIAPIWYLFQFDNKLFTSIDLTKLLLIAPGISCPVIFLNGTLLIFLDKPDWRMNEKGIENLIYTTLIIASTGAGFVFYVPCAMTVGGKVSLSQATIISIGFEIAWLITTVFANKKFSKSELNKPKPQQPA